MAGSGGVVGETLYMQLVKAMVSNKDPVLQISKNCVLKGDCYFDHKGEDIEVGSHCHIPLTPQGPQL